jgi:hypothetical protein
MVGSIDRTLIERIRHFPLNKKKNVGGKFIFIPTSCIKLIAVLIEQNQVAAEGKILTRQGH